MRLLLPQFHLFVCPTSLQSSLYPQTALHTLLQHRFESSKTYATLPHLFKAFNSSRIHSQTYENTNSKHTTSNTSIIVGASSPHHTTTATIARYRDASISTPPQPSPTTTMPSIKKILRRFLTCCEPKPKGRRQVGHFNDSRPVTYCPAPTPPRRGYPSFNPWMEAEIEHNEAGMTAPRAPLPDNWTTRTRSLRQPRTASSVYSQNDCTEAEPRELSRRPRPCLRNKPRRPRYVFSDSSESIDTLAASYRAELDPHPCSIRPTKRVSFH